MAIEVIEIINGTKGERGAGITNAIINPESHLILTFSDGEIKDVGIVTQAGDLIGKIPTKLSQLTNDSGYITKDSDITGNAATATKAVSDGAGNVIADTYMKKTDASNINGATTDDISGLLNG